jgi:hypothetical protein
MKISAYMVVKNAEKFLEANLIHHLPYVDEVVLAVSQSNIDKTNEIVERMVSANQDKVKVFVFNKTYDCVNTAEQRLWPNEYLLRNEAKSYCSGDWIMQIDADEFWDLDFLNNIRHYVESAEIKGFVGYFFPKQNFWKGLEYVRVDEGWSPDTGGLKFFKNLDEIKYVGYIHCTPWGNYGNVMFKQTEETVLFNYPILHLKMVFPRSVSDDGSPQLQNEEKIQLVKYNKPLPGAFKYIKW